MDGWAPPTLFDYLPVDGLWSSMIFTSPFRDLGQYRGDRARKETLVKISFRLPWALDNRPLKFEEVEAFPTRTVCFGDAG
ncbi:hypothetical protein ACNKHU_04440 [Shigella flexneri]